MTNTPLGVGVIGGGKHGARYMRHVSRDLPQLRLAAIARRNVATGSQQAADHGCRFHADWRDLVADPGVQAVVVVVPPSLHPTIVDCVARAGKALLIEKPLATSGTAAASIRDTVRTAGIPALMAHTLRWNVVVDRVRSGLQALGPLRALAINQRFETSTLDWLDDPAVSGGGMILHTGVHSFDLVRYLTGHEVTRVSCWTARADTVQTEDNFLARLELSGSDVLVSVSGSRATLGRSGLIDAAAAKGQLVADHQLHFAYRVRGLERTSIDLPPPTMTVLAVLESFLALIRQGTPPLATIDDGLRAVRIAEACMRAARDQTTVPVLDS